MRLPSIDQQKTFIIQNSGILNRDTQLIILSLVMMEVGATVSTPTGVRNIIMATGGGREVDIDLDAIAEANGEVLSHIYNIVHTRREALSIPAGVNT